MGVSVESIASLQVDPPCFSPIVLGNHQKHLGGCHLLQGRIPEANGSEMELRQQRLKTLPWKIQKNTMQNSVLRFGTKI